MTKKTIKYIFDLTDLIQDQSVKYLFFPKGSKRFRICVRKGKNKWTIFYQDGKNSIDCYFGNGIYLNDVEMVAFILNFRRDPYEIELMYK